VKCPKCGNKKQFLFDASVGRGMSVDLSSFDFEDLEADFWGSIGEEPPMIELSMHRIMCDADSNGEHCEFTGTLKQFGGRWPAVLKACDLDLPDYKKGRKK
jgi:hypothetical protein